MSEGSVQYHTPTLVVHLGVFHLLINSQRPSMLCQATSKGRPTAPMTTREAGFQHDSSIQPEDLPLRHGIRCWNLARGTSRRVKFCESKKSRGSNSLRCLDGIWDHFGSFKGGLMFHRLWMIWDGCEHLEGGI